MGGESSYQNNHLNMQLLSWAIKDGTGAAFDSKCPFFPTRRSRLGPGGSWVSNENLSTLSKTELRKFLRIARSWSSIEAPVRPFSGIANHDGEVDQQWRALAWLIDPEHQHTLVYRQNQRGPETIDDSTISAESPVAGFRLDLKPIWQGLNIPE